MKANTSLKAALVLACLAAVLIPLLRTAAPPDDSRPAKKVSSVHTKGQLSPQTSAKVPVAAIADAEPLLPPPVLASGPVALAAPAVNAAPPPRTVLRPMEESMMLSWAARDPEGAGRWLNQNHQHPKFADMVRGYAVQIALIDPAAARQWAAELNGTGNRFALGGTLEQHIDAVEAMLKSPDAMQTEQPQQADGRFIHADYRPVLHADYRPVLVRQNPGEPPVMEMQPTNPFV